MKATNHLVVMVGVCALFILAGTQTAAAQECRVIRIHGLVAHDAVKVEPESLSISKGTCVIWFNRSTANEIKVVFEEGKQCASVTDAPTGFSLNHEQCYVTSWVPFGGTSSLRFTEKGTYEYAIELAVGDEPERGKRVSSGTIIVRE